LVISSFCIFPGFVSSDFIFAGLPGLVFVSGTTLSANQQHKTITFILAQSGRFEWVVNKSFHLRLKISLVYPITLNMELRSVGNACAIHRKQAPPAG
jgi:hypothetical protein